MQRSAKAVVTIMASKFSQEPMVKPIHFFKIILAHNLHEGKLMIPSAFVKNYGEGLPKTIFLKSPNGREWKLNLVKSDGKIWFQEGWKEFAEYHSLAIGHLLVFKYERTSHFQVLIFDMSALEIEYDPFTRVEGEIASNEQGNESPNCANSEYFRSGHKRKGKSLEFLQPSKMGSSKCVEVESKLKLPKVPLHYADRKCKEKSKTIAKSVTALDRASSFKSSNPSFPIFMRPSYVEFRCNMNFPPEFCKRHFNMDKERGDINLIAVLNGRVWPARYQIRKSHAFSERTKFELIASGWKEFAKDNKLKEGDACTFELILRNKLTFLVHIFRGNDKSNCSTSQAQKREDNLSSESPEPCQMRSCKPVKVENNLKLPKAVQQHAGKKCKGKSMNIANQVTALDRACSFKPCNPSFMVFMHPSYVRSQWLNLPPKFCKKHLSLNKKNGDINLEVLNNGRVWPANYRIWKNNTRTKFVFRRGWKEFTKDNKLKLGDICTFELIPRTKLTFLVHFFRENDNSNCSTSQGSASLKYCKPAQKRKDNLSLEFPQPCEMISCKRVKVENNLELPKAVQHDAGKKHKGKPSTTAKQVSAVDRANSFKPGNPSFMIFMHPTYVYFDCLHLPAKFCKEHLHLDEKEGDVNLEVLNDGRIWPTRHLIREHTTQTRFDLTYGWKAFAQDNKLKLGDVCTFELIPRTKLTFLVHIFRGNDSSNCSTSQAQKIEDNFPMEFPQPCQKRSFKRVEVENNLKLPKAVQQHAGKKCKGKPMSMTKKLTALDRASSFKPCNPSFLIFMHPSYLRFQSRPVFPSNFCKMHFDMEKESGDINLRVFNGRVWPLSYLIRKIKGRAAFELSSGWKAFAEDNKLKLADVCVFELIPRTELTFLVHIFRENDDSSCCTSQESVQVRATSQGQEQELKIITTNKSSPLKSFSV